jgi:SSS family transporter
MPTFVGMTDFVEILNTTKTKIMNTLDYIIVAVYLIGFLFLGNLFKNNNTSKEYFLGGRSLSWFPLSLSTMATQLSAISFISAPAFVGLKLNGGMQWLTFELAVPLAMIFILLFLFPPLFRSGVVSIYEFVEQRFNRSTRMILSIVFQISKALGTGVMVYTLAFILQAVLNIDFLVTIILISIITIAYSWQGGMKAVVWGDAIQMIILFIGLIVCFFYGWQLFTELPDAALDASRFEVVDYNWGFTEGETYGIVPMIVGGFFLYASYYGCDQTQAQRLLSARDEGTVKKLLLANGLLRFPVVLLYSVMGLIIGSLAINTPDFMNAIVEITKQHFPEEYANNGIKADLMMPVFILKYLPHGLIGLLMIGILSAAMSSLSSTINSLAAVSVEDLFKKKADDLDSKKYMRFSKGAVLFWGVVCIGAAYLFGGSHSPVIEIINAIGSVFYGPILATFVLAIFSKKVNSVGMNVGIIVSVAVNLLLSTTVQKIFGFDLGIHVFWMWLNFTGFILAVVMAYAVSMLTKSDDLSKKINIEYSLKDINIFQKVPMVLIGFFIFIIIFSYWIPTILEWF